MPTLNNVPISVRTGVARMPKQKPGQSEQTVVTPWVLIDAVEKRFGDLKIDLAADGDNCRVRRLPRAFLSPRQNSLAQDWSKITAGNAWLNPPYGKTDEAPHGIADWAEKCASDRGRLKVFLLVPAGTGANWFANFIWKKAYVLFLQGRVTFDGHPTPYPKDLILAVYGVKPGAEVWDWRKDA